MCEGRGPALLEIAGERIGAKARILRSPDEGREGWEEGCKRGTEIRGGTRVRTETAPVERRPLPRRGLVQAKVPPTKGLV